MSADEKPDFSVFSANPPEKTGITDSVRTPPAREAAPPTRKSTAESEKDTLSYEADHIYYDMQTKVLHLIGKAVARYQEIVLYADTITYLMDEALFIANGSPRLIDGTDVTVGESMVYNTKTKRGKVRYATSRMGEDYFNGHKIVKTAENHLYIEDGDYTSCAYPEHPHYFFYGKNIKVIPGEKAISRPVVLNIGEAPVAVFPYFMLPLNRGRKSGILTPSWGGTINGGGYIDNIGGYWAPNDYIDFLGKFRIQEFQDFVANASTSYRLRYWLDGGLNVSYALGSGKAYQSAAVTSNAVNTTSQWGVNYSHRQNLTPDGLFTLSGAGSLASSSSFYRTHSEDASEILNQSLNANLSLAKSFPSINANATLKVSRNHDLRTDFVSDEAPGFSFSLPSRPLIPEKKDEYSGTNDMSTPSDDEDRVKWYNRITYNYNTYGTMRHTEYKNDSLHRPEKWLPGLTHGVSINAPQTFFKYVTVTPSVNLNASTFYRYMDTANPRIDTLFDTVKIRIKDTLMDTVYRYRDYIAVDTTDSISYDSTFMPETTYTIYKRTRIPRYETVYKSHDKFHSDYWWNASVGVSTTLYGLFPIRILNLAGIRHTFSPRISYTYTPEQNQEKRFYSIGIPYKVGGKRAQTVGIGIDNLFQGKTIDKPKEGSDKPSENKFTILQAGIGTGYNFEDSIQKWSPLSLTASTSLPFVRISYNSSFWLYNESNQFTPPVLGSYSVSFSPNNFSAGGSFWDGDILVLNKAQPDDPIEYKRAGAQQWELSLSPSYSFSQSRRTASDDFITTKYYTLSASAKLNFTRNWSMNWGSSFDFVKNQFTGHSLNFYCDLECWDMRFNWTPAGINPSYYFLINIKKIPDFKWEQKK